MTGRKPSPKQEWALPVHQARSRDQRDRLLKAGERVFATRGFWESHVDDIARLAECSVGSFYRRFKDKEALFFALQADMAEKASDHIERFFANPLCFKLPITAVIFHLIENSAADAEKIAGYYRALFEMSLRGRQVWDQMRRLELQLAEGLVALLRKRGLAGEGAEDLVAPIAFAIRMVNGVQLSVMLHGAGPYGARDAHAFALQTRVLMQTMSVTPDEEELKRLVAGRRAAAAQRQVNGASAKLPKRQAARAN